MRRNAVTSSAAKTTKVKMPAVKLNAFVFLAPCAPSPITHKRSSDDVTAVAKKTVIYDLW